MVPSASRGLMHARQDVRLKSSSAWFWSASATRATLQSLPALSRTTSASSLQRPDDAGDALLHTPSSKTVWVSPRVSKEAAGDAWQRLRTPSPDTSYFARTGRCPPPPAWSLLQRYVEAPAVSATQDEGSQSLASLSLGSVGHAEGTCCPCAHIWRSQGCSKGRACSHCHACGLEEFNAYKRKAKAVQVLARARKLALAPAEAQSKSQQPSAGSAAHGTGTCRPCAHHWRPGGCSNGASCEFCHLCGRKAFRAFRLLSKELKEQKCVQCGPLDSASPAPRAPGLVGAAPSEPGAA